MKARNLFLIAYDISRNRTRSAALKICRQYATGGQKSLHECWLSPAEHADLLADLALIIDPDTDRITSIGLDGRQSVHTLGRGVSPLDPDLIVIN